MASNVRYGYAVACLKALENRLLDEAFFNRLVESPSLDGAIKVLGETPYSAVMMELKNAAEFDSAIDAEQSRVFKELISFVPDEALVSLCRLIYDVHNVKVVLKGRMISQEGGQRRLELLTNLGNLEGDRVVLAIEGEEYSSLPWGLGDAVRSAWANWEQYHDSRAVETVIDRAYYEALQNIGASLKLDLVDRWIKARIDGDNLKSLLRLSRLQLDPSLILSFLHSGGTLDQARLRSLLSEPVENWARSLAWCNLSSLLLPFQEGGHFNTLLVNFERDLDNYITEVLAPSRYDAFGAVNVIRYLWAREVEARNLRMVLVSLANGVSHDVIRGLLRHV